MNRLAAFEFDQFSAGFRQGKDLKRVLNSVSLEIPRGRITTLIGPPGCGKTTILRSLNRLHEMKEGAFVEGQIWFEGRPLYDSSVDPVSLRARVGMVFQKPVPIPGMSVFENVAVGLRLTTRLSKAQIALEVERSLLRAHLWHEVKDILKREATCLSAGQTQRLCIARALAVHPEVLLLDEPTSALDSFSTSKIEDMAVELKNSLTLVWVTQSLIQAKRLGDVTAYFDRGSLVEIGPTQQFFTDPRELRTQDYVQGRIG